MIRTSHADGVTTLTLDRQDKRNALDAGMVARLAETTAEAEADPDCRCLVIKGAGRDFCAGRDLDDADASTPLAEILVYDETYEAVFQTLRRSSIPSVAVVEGYAVAGGFTLAMACDFVLAERAAKFGALEMRGGFPAAVNTAVLTNLVGPRQALEFLLSAEIFDAEHLFRVGLINRLAEGSAELAEFEREMTAKLTALDPIAVKITKEAHRSAQVMPLPDGLALGKTLNALMMSSGKIDEARERYKRSRGDG